MRNEGPPPALLIENLHVWSEPGAGEAPVPIIEELELALHPGRTLCLVGESGCGKSMTALAIMRLLPARTRMQGRIVLGGTDLSDLEERAMCAVRGRRMAMIFQEPMSALDPIRTIGFQLTQGPQRHLGLSPHEAQHHAEELMRRVGLPPEQVPQSLYPHQLSGGQRQRAMIAMALACVPDVLIADEPTTALDVTVQARILRLLAEIAGERRMALLLITHDLGVAAAMADDIAVMYAGRIVTKGPCDEVFTSLSHPYARALFEAMPRLDASRPPAAIAGRVPAPDERPHGCAFAPRCERARTLCHETMPALSLLPSGERVACHYPHEGPAERAVRECGRHLKSA